MTLGDQAYFPDNTYEVEAQQQASRPACCHSALSAYATATASFPRKSLALARSVMLVWTKLRIVAASALRILSMKASESASVFKASARSSRGVGGGTGSAAAGVFPLASHAWYSA